MRQTGNMQHATSSTQADTHGADDAATMEPSALEWVTVRTTLPAMPFPPLDQRPEIRTERLVLRPTLDSDADAWHALRSQPEVMAWTLQGRPDKDAAASREQLQRRLGAEGAAAYDFVVCCGATGEMVGVAGCHHVDGELGWPVIGYLLLREAWGRGYATEALHAFLAAWWALPRAEAELRVERSTVAAGRAGRAAECLVAVAASANAASQRVLRKCGLRLAKTWEEEDARDPARRAVVCAFVSVGERMGEAVGG